MYINNKLTAKNQNKNKPRSYLKRMNDTMLNKYTNQYFSNSYENNYNRNKNFFPIPYDKYNQELMKRLKERKRNLFGNSIKKAAFTEFFLSIVRSKVERMPSKKKKDSSRKKVSKKSSRQPRTPGSSKRKQKMKRPRASSSRKSGAISTPPVVVKKMKPILLSD
mgnify:CR=1 FL=1